MGRETVEGFVASAYSAKSTETSPKELAFDNPYTETRSQSDTHNKPNNQPQTENFKLHIPLKPQNNIISH